MMHRLQPAIVLPEHDLRRATYSPHSTQDGSIVFDARCRRCWYEKARVQNDALLEAAKQALNKLRLAYGPAFEGDDDEDCIEPQHDIQLILADAVAQAEGRTA